MASISVPTSPKEGTTRIGWALLLLEEHGGEVEKIAPGIYSVPSSDGADAYVAHYGGDAEDCQCQDFQFHGHEEPCKHLLMLGLLGAKRRARPGFRCDGCGCRTPHCDGHDVHPDHASGVFEVGMRVCSLCARAHGVL